MYNVFLYIDPYGIKALKCSIFDDLIAYDPSKTDNSSESIDELNAIVGGDY